jgi:hypothetical protein
LLNISDFAVFFYRFVIERVKEIASLVPRKPAGAFYNAVRKMFYFFTIINHPNDMSCNVI